MDCDASSDAPRLLGLRRIIPAGEEDTPITSATGTIAASGTELLVSLAPGTESVATSSFDADDCLDLSAGASI